MRLKAWFAARKQRKATDPPVLPASETSPPSAPPVAKPEPQPASSKAQPVNSSEEKTNPPVKREGVYQLETTSFRKKPLPDDPVVRAAQLSLCAHAMEFFPTFGKQGYTDGVDDETGADWLWLNPGEDPLQAVKDYAVLKAYYTSAFPFHHDRMVLILNDEKELELPQSQLQELYALCDEHNILLAVIKTSRRFVDPRTGENWLLVDGPTYPGSADDAATYGTLFLIKEGEDS